MKCTECVFCSYVRPIDTWFCDANRNRPKRIDPKDTQKDVPCSKGIVVGTDYTIRQLRAITGLTQVEFGAKYEIPVRTIKNWESDASKEYHRTCPEYVRRLLSRIISEDYIAHSAALNTPTMEVMVNDKDNTDGT